MLLSQNTVHARQRKAVFAANIN